MTGRVVAIIPARYSSTRLPGKALAAIGGKPMIQHVYERTAGAKLVHDVLVATDDERIVAAVNRFGGHVALTPSSLKSGTDRIAFAARPMTDAEIIVNVQGDEPLIVPEMIDQAVQPLVDDPGLPVGTLVRRIDSADDLTNPNIPKVVLDRNSDCLFFSRSAIPYGRDIPPSEWLRHHTYYKHIGLYVFRRDFLLRFAEMSQTPLELAEKLEQLRVLEHGFKMRGTVTSFESVPVDTQADLDKVRALVSQIPSGGERASR